MRKVIITAVLLSSIVSAATLYLAKRWHDAPFEDAADRVAKIKYARIIAKQYAFEAFPAWVVEHPDYACPQRVSELNVYANRETALDPWGLPFQSYCHSGNTFRVVSAGPDRTHGTYDDIVEGT